MTKRSRYSTLIGVACAIWLPESRALMPRRPRIWSTPTFQLAAFRSPEAEPDVAANLQSKFESIEKELSKTCQVRVAPVASGSDDDDNGMGLGLFATSDLNEGDKILSIPYDDRYVISPDSVRNVVYKKELPDGFDGWTGDTGLIAMGLLNEIARAAGTGLELPKRDANLQSFMAAWVESLPSPSQPWHPLLWNDEDQEVLQNSSTNKIYQRLDDIDEDASWLSEKLWALDRSKFPERVFWNGEIVPCFCAEGFKWAMSLALSRSVFCDGSLRLIPMMDMVNHDDKATEVSGDYMGTFGTTQGASLVASKAYAAGEQVFCSYGPKSAADYLLENGFCPPIVWKTAMSEIAFEIDPEERFADDKLDILEFETYDLAPMDPLQKFDLVSEFGRDGEPDPAMIQFLRLKMLGGSDAFLLESIFRKQTWGFMELPVSEENELAVTETLIAACDKALSTLNECPDGGPLVCTQLRESEIKALSSTRQFMVREKEALDLKEYYQERRLKELGLDSEWNPDEENDVLGYGQTRAPGGADYDW